MNEKLSEELLSQKLMKLQRNSRRGLVLFQLESDPISASHLPCMVSYFSM